jgi:hypothetical protein
MPTRTMTTGAVRLAPVPRAVADAVRQLTDARDIRAIVADAVQLGRCTVGQLAAEFSQGPVRGSAVLRSVLAEVADGIRSTAEGDLRDLITTARLPMPLFNPSLFDGDLFLGKPDAWWPDAGVAGEVDSRAWHLSPGDWDRTRRRGQGAGAGLAFGEGEGHFFYREQRGDVEGEELAAVHDGLQAAEGGLGGRGGGELAQVGLGVGELGVGA